MDRPGTNMDNSNINSLDIYLAEKFRIPTEAEEKLGLWVDRIGKMTTSSRPGKMRMLGQYAFIYILRGNGFYLSRIHGEKRVSEGDCMAQFPADPCLYYPETEWTTVWVTWNGSEAYEIDGLNYLPRRQPVFPDPNAAALQAYAKLSPLMHKEDAQSIMERKSCLLEMVLNVYRASLRVSKPSRHEPVIQDAVDWIYNHYTEPLNIEEMAGNFSLSSGHFRRLFRDYTGRSPSDFIRSLRMAEAKSLLREGRAIKEAAARTGYDDVYYFMRVFKKAVGETPGSFQKKH